MRAFVEHRGRYGLFGFSPRYTFYLAIQFSNEERAIIQQRALQNYIFDLSPGYLATSESRFSPDALWAMTLFSVGLFLLGFVFIFLSAIAAPSAGRRMQSLQRPLNCQRYMTLSSSGSPSHGLAGQARMLRRPGINKAVL
jgi:hypothetical protein